MTGRGRPNENARHRVALIGMPGSGKSSLGSLAARALGFAYVDLDAMIALSAGISIPEIFARDGESGFRTYETNALAELVSLADQDADQPCVLSTGGGVVTVPQNLALLKRFGRVVYIKRDLDDIAASVGFAADRPLLADREKLFALWESRKELYETWADNIFDNAGDETAASARLAQFIADC